MLLKLSIDLNFLSPSCLTFKSLGFIDTEPVDFLFYINDTKIINYSKSEVLKMDLFELIGFGLLTFNQH